MCIDGQRGAPPETGRGTWAYLERLAHHRPPPPIEAMLMVADALHTWCTVDPHTTAREAIGALDKLREAVDRLAAYEQLQPEYFDGHDVNSRLHAWVRHGWFEVIAGERLLALQTP
jgi:hypothetical protein